MTAIFAGLGSGLERGSANILGGAGQLGSGAVGRAGENVSVNAATGNLVVTGQDEFLVGRGLDIGVSRSYNSLAQWNDGDNGDQWQQSTTRRVFGLSGTLNSSGSTIKRQGADGSVITYAWNAGEAAYVSTDGAGAHDQLKKVGSKWVWTDGSSQITESYGAYGADNWRITEQKDNDGYKLTFTYTGSKLDKVTTANGEWLQYSYSGNKITQITTGYTDLATSTAQTLVRTRYSYDAQDRLSQVITDLSPEDGSIADNQTYITTYTYKNTSGDQVATIAQSDGSLMSINYQSAAANAKVTSVTQTVASGDTRVTALSYGAGYTNVTGPDGQVTRMDYDADKQLTKITAPPAYAGATAQIAQFAYDASGNVTSVTDAAGSVTSYTYYADGNVKQITDPNNNKTYHWYDANGNLTRQRTYGAYAASSNVAQYTRYTYDSENHLRYAISSEGYVTEYRYTAYGQLQYEIGYSEQSYAAGSAIPTNAQMDAWRDAIADRSSTQLTRYNYDERGNIWRTWNYGAASAAGAASGAEGYSRTYFTYDQAGQLLSTHDNSQISETFVYDGMGRLTASTDLSGGTTSFVFNDAASQTVVTTASGYVTTSTYNKAGELISQTGSGSYDPTGTSTYKYDKNGQIRQSTDETGFNTYFLYDKAGRKIADINHYGHVSEYRYNDAGRVAASVNYTHKLTSAQVTSLQDPNSLVEMSSIRPAAHSYDIWEWNVYDAAGRVIETIGGTGGVTKFEYDNSDRLVKTLSYYNKLSASQLTAFKADAPTALVLPTANAAKDAVSRTFYDRDGRVLGNLDGEGYLTHNIYDKAGQLTQTIAYAGITTSSLRAGGSFNQLKSGLAGAGDRRSYNVYDGQGQLRYSVNGQGAVSSFTYNKAGKLTKTVEHAATISTSDYTYDNVKTKVAAIADTANDRTSSIVYRNNGEINYTQDVAGLRTYYTYDNRGQVTKTVTGTGGDARTVRSWYTAGGDLRFTVDAEGYVKRFDYDAAGRLTREKSWSSKVTASDATTMAQINSLAGGAGTWTDMRYTYDAAGRRNSVYDGEGNRTIYTWRSNGASNARYDAHSGADGTNDRSIAINVNDGAGRTKMHVQANGEAERTNAYFYYDGLGNLTSTKDPNGKTTTYTYDERGQVLTETNAAGGVTSYEYNAFGQVVKLTDPRGSATYNYYDNLGRLTKTRDAESYVTETSYTLYGEVASVKRYHNKTSSAVSTVTPPTVTAHSEDTVTTFEYDKRGLVTKSTDAEGYFENNTYNTFGQRVQSSAKWQKSLTVEQETNSNALILAGDTTQYVYDKRGLLVSETLPIKSFDSSGAPSAANITNVFEYDARGNRTKMIEASGLPEARTTEYIYDDANRLIETIGQTFLNQTPHEYITYDARDNVTSTTDAAGAKTIFFYDDLNRKTVEINALGTYTKYSYDKNGNVTEARVYVNTVAVPGDGGSEEEQPALPAGASRVTSFTYDNLNRMLTSTVAGATTGHWNGSGWVQATSALTTSYQYDANGNVVKMTDPNGGTTWSHYDKSGRKIAQVDTEKYITKWTYDSEGSVTREIRYAVALSGAPSLNLPASPNAAGSRVTDFTYDKVGNRLEEKRQNVLVHNGSGGQANAAWSTISYLYNGLGQVTRKTESTGDAVDYTYDAGGRLTNEERETFSSHQNANVKPEVNYYYDGLGNLSRSVAVGAGDAVSRVTTYSYDGGKLATMIDAEGFVHRYKYDIAGRQTHDYYTRVKSDGSDAAPFEGALTIYDLLGRATEQYQATSTNQNTWVDNGPRAVTAYNANGEVAAVSVGGIAQQENKYDAAGRLWATNSGDGVWKYFGYDKNGKQTLAITSAGADLTGKTFAQAKALIGQSDVNATYTQYDKRGLATTVVEEGRQLAQTGALQTLTTTRVYNAFGEVTAETNADNATIDYTYNNMGRLIKSESPLVSVTAENGAVSNVRPTEQYYYDVSGRLVASRDANGNLTKQTLLAGTGYGGSQALVTHEIHADGGIKQTQFDIHGDARKMIDEIGRTTTQSYDKMGRIEQINHAGGLTDNYTYDGLGQQLTHWNNQLGTGNKQYTDYDTQGRVISVRAFGGDVTNTSYTWTPGIVTTGLSTAAVGGWTAVTTYANSKTLTEQTDLFGRIISKNDLGGHVTNFTYDKAGRLSGSDIGGITNTYEYLNTGQLGKTMSISTITTTDTYGTSTTITTIQASYEYDKVGNRLKELGETIKDITYTPSGGGSPHINTIVETWKDASATYDALGRLTGWTEAGSDISPASSMNQYYDANGNIRRTTATFRELDAQGAASTTATTKDYWFRFDNMNRLVTDKGELSGAAGASGTTIVATPGSPYGALGGGQEILYDEAGQRVAALAIANYTDGYGGSYTTETRETYTYDAAGRLQTTHVTQGTNVPAPIPDVNSTVGRRQAFTYDKMGRQLTQNDYTGNGTTVAFSRSAVYNAKGQLASEVTNTRRGSDTYLSSSTYSYGTGTGYALGSALSVSSLNAKNGNYGSVPNTLTTNTYDWYDGAVQATITHKPNTSQSTQYLTTFYHNDAGQLTRAHVGDYYAQNVTFTNDENGQIIRRDESSPSNTTGAPHEVWYRFGGRQMGYTGNNGTSDISTTASIAERQMTSGDKAFRNGAAAGTAYADFANSYDPLNSYNQGAGAGQYTVQAGDTLQSIAQNIYGDSSLWYKIAQANGIQGAASLITGQRLSLPAGVTKNTHNASTLKPYDPSENIGDLTPTTSKPPKKNKCGVFGQILLAVIAVAVSFALPALAPGVFGGVAGGIGAAVAGSVVSQGVGIATGIQDKFSFKGVALAALSAGVGAGVGSVVKGAVAGSKLLGDVVRGALTSGITQGIGVATGLQSKFSFAGVAAAGIGAGVGGAVGRSIGGGAEYNANGDLTKAATLGHSLAVAAASGIANAATRSAINGNSFGDNLTAALPDIIGQAVGGAIGQGLQRKSGEQQASAAARDTRETALASARQLTDAYAGRAQREVAAINAQATGNLAVSSGNTSIGEDVAAAVTGGGSAGSLPYKFSGEKSMIARTLAGKSQYYGSDRGSQSNYGRGTGLSLSDTVFDMAKIASEAARDIFHPPIVVIADKQRAHTLRADYLQLQNSIENSIEKRDRAPQGFTNQGLFSNVSDHFDKFIYQPFLHRPVSDISRLPKEVKKHGFLKTAGEVLGALPPTLGGGAVSVFSSGASATSHVARRLTTKAPLTANQIGRAGEDAVAKIINIPRNAGPGRTTIQGTGPGGLRIPDFDPSLTIIHRGTVVEVKNVQTLKMSDQIRDLEQYARKHKVPLEIFTNGKVPQSGELAREINRGRIIISNF